MVSALDSSLLGRRFLLIRGLLLFFLCHLIRLLFGRVLTCVCEAQLRLCVKFCQYGVLVGEQLSFLTFVCIRKTLLAPSVIYSNQSQKNLKFKNDFRLEGVSSDVVLH